MIVLSQVAVPRGSEMLLATGIKMDTSRAGPAEVLWMHVARCGTPYIINGKTEWEIVWQEETQRDYLCPVKEENMFSVQQSGWFVRKVSLKLVLKYKETKTVGASMLRDVISVC